MRIRLALIVVISSGLYWAAPKFSHDDPYSYLAIPITFFIGYGAGRCYAIALKAPFVSGKKF